MLGAPILVRAMHGAHVVKPTLAALTGFLLAGAIYACSVPNVQGTAPTEGDTTGKSSSSSGGTKPTSTSAKTRAPSNTKAPTSTQARTTDAGTTQTATADAGSTIDTTTLGSGSTSSSSSSSGATGTTTQPACRNDADPIACLDCCLTANPGAQSFEDAYGACLGTCDAGDQNCVNLCFDEHLNDCQTSADCLANHACMAANNCLVSNLCAAQ